MIPGGLASRRVLTTNSNYSSDSNAASVKNLPVLQFRYLIIRHVSLLPAVINLCYMLSFSTHYLLSQTGTTPLLDGYYW
jgi:hypothetical protein